MLPTPMPPFYRRRGDNPHVPLPFVPPSRISEVTLAQHIADKGDPHETLKLLNENLATFVTGGRFVPETCRIEFMHGTEVLDSIDASPFVKDGMVQSVAVSDGNLVITWNSDSGASTPTSIPLADIFNPDNFYDKTSADGKFVAKETGKRLITDAEGTKLSGVESGAKDNVVEAAGVSAFPQTGAVGKIYVAKNENEIYRWDGAQYVKVGGGGAHAATHRTGGSDPLTPGDIGAATTAQGAKADSAIQGVQVNGTDLAPDAGKKVNVVVPEVTATMTVDGMGRLHVEDADGNRIWEQGYGLKSASSYTLDSDNVNKYEFAVNAAGAVALVLPPLSDGKASDIVLDVRNPALDSTAADYPAAFDATATYAVGDRVLQDGAVWVCVSAVSTAGAWTGTDNWQTAQFNLDMTNYRFMMTKGDDLQEMLTFAPGEMAALYFTQMAFRIDDKPTYWVSKQKLEVVS